MEDAIHRLRVSRPPTPTPRCAAVSTAPVRVALAASAKVVFIGTLQCEYDVE